MSDSFSAPRRYKYWEQPWFKWLGLMMAGMVYLVFRSPFVGFNDGLSFLLEAETGFSTDTNATNHFLYINIQHILVSVFSFLSPVVVMTVFSIMCSLGSLIRVYQIGKLFVGPIPVLPIPPMVLALSFTFWQQTEIIEVYAFNNFLFLTTIHLAFKDLVKRSSQYALPVSLLMGLLILTHIQHILFLPFFIYYLIRCQKVDPVKPLLGFGIFAGLSSILFILPLATQNHSLSAVFFDSKFQDEVLGFDFGQLMEGAGKAMLFLMYNFHIFLVFVIHGWYKLYKDRREFFWQHLLILIPYLGFAVKYSVADNHVFFLVPYLILIPPMTMSLMSLAFKLMPYMSWMVPMMMMMSPMMYMGATMMGKDHPRLATYQTEKAYKGGVKHLLWPGKRSAKDPLALAKEIYEQDPSTDPATIEWNYETAIKYLKFKGKL